MNVLVHATLNAPIDALWALVGDFSNLPAWSPSVQRCNVEGTGVGSHRTIVTAAGEVRERLDSWDPAVHLIAYTPVSGSSLPLSGSHASIRLISEGEHRTLVEWRIEGEPLRPADEVEQLLRARYSARLEDLRLAVVTSVPAR